MTQTAVKSNSASFAVNEEKNGLEISFTAKPDRATLDALKGSGFRWHNVRKLWYAKNTPERLAMVCEICHGDTPTERTQTAKTAPKKPKKGTRQDHIKFFWNGLKIDGKLTRCFYSVSDDRESVTIHARDYEDLPRDLFEVRNETDIMTDYFDEDHATLTKTHPLFRYALYVGMKAQARQDRDYCEKLRETLNSGRREPWPGHFDNLRKDLARREQFLAEFDSMTDPGQPTAEELAEIDRQRTEAENARKAAEHAAQIAERERVLADRVEGMHYIQSVAEQYPIEDGAPVVEIPFSECPAFYNFTNSRDQIKTTIHPDGTREETIITPRLRCLLSVTAADIVLKHFDELHTEPGYDKTDFIITWTDPETGEESSYEGRYDLGDHDGGMIEHIRRYGEWYLTHDAFGHKKSQPETENDQTRFAEFLKGYRVA